MAAGQTSFKKVDASIYPKPEKGVKQMVIEVPHSENDSNKKIEFVIGKWMEVDTCNKHGLVGNLEKRILKDGGIRTMILLPMAELYLLEWLVLKIVQLENLLPVNQPQ